MRAASTRAGAHKLLPLGSACGCKWAWFQRTVSGRYVRLGCTRHSSAGAAWTARTTAFHVKREVKPGDWQSRSWAAEHPGCRRGGGLYSHHECDRRADDHGKRCRCACGAVE